MLKAVKKNNYEAEFEYIRDSKLQVLYEKILKTDPAKRKEVFRSIVTELVSDYDNTFCLVEGMQFIVSDMDVLYEMINPSVRQNSYFQFLLDEYMRIFRRQVKSFKEPSFRTSYIVLRDSEDAQKGPLDFLRKHQ